MNNQLEDLTKGLAHSLSRRATLRQFCVGLAGMMLTVLVAALLLVPLGAAFGQSAAEAWVGRYGTLASANDVIAQVVTDQSGDVIVAGSTDGRLNGNDFLVIKYSQAGVPLWTNRYDGPVNRDDVAVAVAVDESGDIFVTGSSESGRHTEYAFINDYATIKYSSTGLPLWTNRYQGAGYGGDSPSSLVVDGDGNVIVTGSSFFTGCVTIKYSGAGVALWTNIHDVPSPYPHAAALDGDGNVCVTGDFGTIKYSAEGVPLWTNLSAGIEVAVDATGNVVVTYGGETIKYSSAGEPLWTNLFEGHGSFDSVGVALDTSGNVFVTGVSGGVDPADYGTVAYSSAGVPLWTNFYNGPANGSDEVTDIAVDASGNVFVTGISATNSGFGYFGYDCATIKYSPSGDELWARRFDGPAEYVPHASRIAVDASGDVLVAVDAAGSIAEHDYVTVKYSGAGEPLWTNRYNGLAYGADFPTAMAVASNGNVVVTGWSWNGHATEYKTLAYSSAGVPLWTNSGGGLAAATDSKNNVVVTSGEETIKYSSVGVPLWTNHWFASVSEGFHPLAVDASGDVVITGHSPGSNGFKDYATIKYSSAGVQLWTNFYNGPRDIGDEAYSVAVDGNGNVAVTGYSPSSRGDDDWVTIRYSSAGVPIWTNRYNGQGNGDDYPMAVAVDHDGNVLVAGSADNGVNYESVTVKYSVSGGELWVRTIPSGRWRGIAVDGADDVIVAQASVTVKYSSAGVALWTNRNQLEFGAMAVDSSGNVFVTGTANNTNSPPLPYTSHYDFATVAYSSAGVPLWTNYYNGPRNRNDIPTAIAVDNNGNVFVTGSSINGYNPDWLTIMYSPAAIAPILLDHQVIGNQLVLSWSNATFSLQSAPVAQGDYTNIPGATSPHTNSFSGPQQYFRLKTN